MIEIKTIRDNLSGVFDERLERALNDGWRIIGNIRTDEDIHYATVTRGERDN